MEPEIIQSETLLPVESEATPPSRKMQHRYDFESRDPNDQPSSSALKEPRNICT